MPDSPFPSDNYIIDCLRKNYGIKATSLVSLSWGADLNALLFKAQTLDRAYFIKLKRGFETTIVELLSKIPQIIAPIKTINGYPVLHMGDFSLLVYPFIEGVNGFSRKLTDTQWMTLGKALRQVHDCESPLLKNIRQETYSPKWRQAVRDLYTASQANNDVIALKFLNYLTEHRAVIEHLVDRAEQLCGLIKDQPEKFVLCHSDIHGGNVLINESDIYIVDWDELIMAPKERDLMFIGGGVANVWNDPKEEILFYKGYGQTEVNPSILAYYRHERIVQDIAEFGQGLLKDTHKDRAELYNHFIAMFNPKGVVEIAFNTKL